MTFNPKITIGGIVPIIAQNFYWEYTAGAYPFTTNIQIDKKHTKLLEGELLNNPTFIEINMRGSKTGEPIRDYTHKIDRVWLLEPMDVSPLYTTWRVADNRFSYAYDTITCSYNKTRVKNSVVTSMPTELGRPSDIRKDYDTFGEGRYLYWSIRGLEVPYTVQEILERELNNLGIFVAPMPKDEESYYLENVEFNAVSAPSVLEAICALGRYQIGINPDGSIYAYNLDYYDKDKLEQIRISANNRKLSSGKLYKQDRSRMRPNSITTLFERKEEIWLTKSSSETSEGSGVFIGNNYPLPVAPKPPVWDNDDILWDRVVGVENVIQIPYPVAIDGTERLVGEWIPMWQYLKTLGITQTEIRQGWFNNSLETIYVERQHALNLPRDVNNEPVWRGQVAAIRKHYRQTFRIDPIFMDKINSWENKRVGIVDNYSKFVPPSPVFSDYTVLVKSRQPKVAKRTAGWENENYVYKVEDRDYGRIQSTPGIIEMISQPLGIFRVAYPSTQYSALFDIIPFALNTSVKRGTGQSFLGTQDFLISASHIEEKWSFETIISVVRGAIRNPLNPVPTYDSRRFYPIAFTGGVGFPIGRGPTKIVAVNSEYARFAVKEIAKGSEPGSWFIKNINIDPVNSAVIGAIARGEASKIIHNFDDYYAGTVTLGGIYDDLRLMANIQSIGIQISPDAGLRTIITFMPVTPPSLEQRVKQDTINFLHRHVTRADERNMPVAR